MSHLHMRATPINYACSRPLFGRVQAHLMHVWTVASAALRLCMYFPVRICPREGQHTGVWANALTKVVPPPPSSFLVYGIALLVESNSRSWSSVSMRTMFGCVTDALQLASTVIKRAGKLEALVAALRAIIGSRVGRSVGRSVDKLQVHVYLVSTKGCIKCTTI